MHHILYITTIWKLGTTDFIHDFTIMFTYAWIYIKIHRSWNVAYEFMIMLCEFITWIQICIRDHEKHHIRIHIFEFIQEFRLLNSYVWSHLWIYIMNSFMNSVLCRISSIHGWISIINSHMKSWLNSLILNGSGFGFKSVSVMEQILLIQSNHNPFFAVSSLPALRLLRGCCSMATGRRGCDCRRRVLQRTVVWGGLEGLALTSRSAWRTCQQWRKLWKT